MPSIKDQSTVNALAVKYTSNGRDKAQAMRTIGYAESSCKSGKAVKDVYGNLRVIKAIAKIDTKTSKKYEHNQEIAIKKLYSDYENLETAAVGGNISAIQARTAIIRELNDITGQHKQIIDNRSREPVVVFSPELQAEIDAAFARDKLRKANELGQVRGTG